MLGANDMQVERDASLWVTGDAHISASITGFPHTPHFGHN
jgi:hypothetical protein